MGRSPRLTFRQAESSDAPALHALISAHTAEGRLLPRTFEELEVHAGRFVVALKGRTVVGCGELAPLSPAVAEVRSLAVDGSVRRHGVGTRIVDLLRREAQREGFDRLCAFTHAPAYFMPMGFSIVPHLWVPEKVFTDCVGCAKFRRCGQYAMVMALDSVADSIEHETTVAAPHP
jgi:amino-acid N-acetyltransferase